MIGLAVVVALVISAVFSGAETVLLSFHRVRLGHRSMPFTNPGRWGEGLEGDTSRILATVLVANSLATVFLASLVTLWAAARWGETAVWVVIPAVTLLVLVFGEILPKSLARAHAAHLRGFLAPLVGIAYAVLRPWVAAVNGAAWALLRGLRLVRHDPVMSLTRQDLQMVMAESEELGRLAPLQGRILRRALDFADTPVETVMVPRTGMVAIPLGTTVAEAGQMMRDKRLSRLPVYRDDLDQVVGVVHRFDLFRAPTATLSVDGLVRPVYLVPESKHAHELLRELQARRQRMAIVLDEYGGTAGLVTVEDLVEELVGEIREKHEPDLILRRLDAFGVAVPGTARLDELKDAIGLALPEGDYETVAGFLLDRLGRIPRLGESLTVGAFRIEVLSADRRRVDQVAVRRVRDGKKPA